MLRIHLSNRFECLLDRLAEQMRQGPRSAFAPVPVIVPSAAVRRCVTLHLADRLGVCANVDFGYPAAWIWGQVARAARDVAAASPFDPEVLVWRVYRALGDDAFVSAHPRLAAYVGRADDVMRYELAARVAALLEQYVTYRPDWMACWAEGRPAQSPAGEPPPADEAWQAALWQRIAGELSLPREHPALAMVRALEAGEDLGLPAAIHVFGLPALAPLYVGLLQQLGRWMDVHVYAVNPCREYWFDVVGTRRLSWLAARGEARSFEQGHRLLADWGRQTQAFLGSLVDVDGDVVVDDDAAFEPAAAGTLLAALQDAILDLQEPAPSSLPLADGDRSIEVHVCHSATRELEVLHDFLLALFAGPDAPSPADILVVTPDLEATAPLVEAVFGAAPAERRIPFAVTGLPEREANPYSRLLLDVLAFVRSRCGVAELFELLQHEPLARRFGFDPAALDDIQAWMQAAGMHWALDGAHRSGFDLPCAERHTLDDGLQRLFLGYALPGAAEAPFLDRLPAAGVRGSESRALGALWSVVRTLAALHRQASHARPGEQWCRLLAQTLEELTSPSRDDLAHLLQLRRALHALQERLAEAAAVQPMPLAVVHAALQRLLEEPARGGVPSGTVTFASLGSLRGLPYKVVCAIGLNDGVVPSPSRPCEFDLMAVRPRAGDRQRAVDERNVFLDLVLAARARLYLSHVGRSVRDNSSIPPSILVSELVEHLVAAVALEPREARRRLVVEHPLQPFSTTCFVAGDPRVRSFDRDYAQALRHASTAAPMPLGAPAQFDEDDEDEEAAWDPRAPFFARPLAPADDSWREVALPQLAEFFRNPCAFLLRHRMSIELPRADEALDDDEPLVPGYAQRVALAARLLPHALAGLPGDALKALARAGIEYPGGALGERQMDAELACLQDYAARVRADTGGAALPPRRIDVAVEVDGTLWRVHGDYADLRAGGLVRHRYDDTRVGDYLGGWLPHLLLCAGAPDGVAPSTRWHSRDGRFDLKAVDGAHDVLAALVRLYARGLQRPLRFFARSAWAYVTEGMDLAQAQSTWTVTPRRPYAEGADAAYALALRGVADPLDDEFTACAKAVFEPLLGCLEDIRR